ncbi:MAG: hypothetical protein ACT4NT_07235 [Nitrososphaerota archaeon]
MQIYPSVHNLCLLAYTLKPHRLAPSGCGFSKTNSMGFASAGVYKSQIVAWESMIGINIPEDD